MNVEVAFPVEGVTLSADHHYLLYSALSRAVPAFHSDPDPVRFGPIGGPIAGRGAIRLERSSRLKFRLAAERIALLLPLAGTSLRVGADSIRLGVPSVRPLLPVTQLVARIVTFKNSEEPERFLEVAKGKLAEMNVLGQPAIPLIEEGQRAGEPRRRILWIKDKKVVGFTLLVEGLSAEESILLQECGLGGRTRMGCGFFVPFRERGA